MRNPCLQCEFGDQDKNNERCANCEKRIEYAQKQGMIPTEALEADRFAREETVKIRELKPTEPRHTGRPKKGKELGPSRRQVFLRFPGKHMDIYDDLAEIADVECRTIAMQSVLFVKQGIEKWKKEHK